MRWWRWIQVACRNQQQQKNLLLYLFKEYEGTNFSLCKLQIDQPLAEAHEELPKDNRLIAILSRPTANSVAAYGVASFTSTAAFLRRRRSNSILAFSHARILLCHSHSDISPRTQKQNYGFRFGILYLMCFHRLDLEVSYNSLNSVPENFINHHLSSIFKKNYIEMAVNQETLILQSPSAPTTEIPEE